MPIQFVHDAARLQEVALVSEATYGTYLNPTSGNGGVQPMLDPGARWGRGHVPAQAVAATGDCQLVVTNRSMRGIDFPFVELPSEFGPSTRDLFLELMMGSALSGGQWAFNDFPASKSICCNLQRSGGASAWNFAGAYCGGVDIEIPGDGTPATVAATLAATSLVDPQSATAMPALTPAAADDGYILHRATFRHSASTSFGTSVPIMGISLQSRRVLIVDHASEKTEPQCITPATFAVQGTIAFKYSRDLETEFQDIWAKEGDGGYTGTRYLELLLQSGSSPTRLTIPTRMDASSLDASNLDDGVLVPVTFMAGKSDAAGTVPTILVQDS